MPNSAGTHPECFDQSDSSQWPYRRLGGQEKGADMTLHVLRQAKQGTSQATNAWKTANAIQLPRQGRMGMNLDALPRHDLVAMS